MRYRYVPALLFLSAAVVSAVIGVVRVPHNLPIDIYLNPFFWMFSLQLFPFAVAGLCAISGLIYLAFEKRWKRRVSLPLAIVQLLLTIVWALTWNAGLEWWSHALNASGPGHPVLPIRIFMGTYLALAGTLLSLLVNLGLSFVPRKKVQTGPGTHTEA